jgi:hypothetical protein
MPGADFMPAPQPEMQEVATERFPHFGIPGFEKLPPDIQQTFLHIPATRLEAARPIIEEKIRANVAENAIESNGQADTFQSDSLKISARTRETQATSAIDSFHRAERGDPDAKKELEDHKKEMFDEEPDDEDIFKTILESESGNPFAQDLVMETMLSDPEAKATQKVLDLFKDFRGDLPSVDDALSPKLQIELFTLLTKGKGLFRERLDFARKALEALTGDGTIDIFNGLQNLMILNDGEIAENGVKQLQKLTDAREARPE